MGLAVAGVQLNGFTDILNGYVGLGAVIEYPAALVEIFGVVRLFLRQQDEFLERFLGLAEAFIQVGDKNAEFFFRNFQVELADGTDRLELHQGELGLGLRQINLSHIIVGYRVFLVLDQDGLDYFGGGRQAILPDEFGDSRNFLGTEYHADDKNRKNAYANADNDN